MAGNANSGRRVSKRKYKGQAARTAIALFGIDPGPGRNRVMESPEDRETMALILRMSDKPAFKNLAADALNPLPELRATSFGKLAERHALNIHSISEELKAIHKSLGFMRAAPIMQELIVETAEAARTREKRCNACNATGQIIKDDVASECQQCEGKGKVRVLGNLDRLKLAFETFGLTQKGGGVQIGVNLGDIKPHETMAELSASVAPLLEGELK